MPAAGLSRDQLINGKLVPIYLAIYLSLKVLGFENVASSLNLSSAAG